MLLDRLADLDIIKKIDKMCDCGGYIGYDIIKDKLYCNNEECYHKIAVRMKCLLRAYGIESQSLEWCEGVTKKYSVKTPYQFCLLVNNSSDIDEGLIEKFRNRVNKGIALHELVKAGGFKGLKESEYELFGGYDNFEDFYIDFEEYDFDGICNILNCTVTEAINISNELKDIKEELLWAQSKYKVNKGEEGIIRAYIGKLSGRIDNKYELLRLVRSAGMEYKKFVSYPLINDKTSLIISSDKVECDIESYTPEKFMETILYEGD